MNKATRRLILALTTLLVLCGPVGAASGDGPIPLEASSATSPVLAAYNGAYYLLWVDTRGGVSELYLNQTGPDGEWGSSEAVVVAGSTVAPGSRPALAVDGTGLLHIAWVDMRSDAHDLYYSNRPVTGGAWTPAVKVNDTADQVWGPALVADPSGAVCAAWRDSRDSGTIDDETQNRTYIYASKRPVGGAWGPNVHISSSDTPEDREAPALALAGGILRLAWADFREGNSDIYYEYISLANSIWTIGGAYNTVNQRVNPDDSGVDQKDPAIVVDSAGDTFVAWADDTGSGVGDENWDIYISRLPFGWTSWTGLVPQRLNNDLGSEPQGQPTLEVDSGGNLYAAWYDARGRGVEPYSWSIQSARIIVEEGLPRAADGSNTPLNDTTPSPGREQPILAAAGDHAVLAVWRDFRDGSPRLYSANFPIPTVANLTDGKVEAGLKLTWGHLGELVDHYEVHRSTDAYFMPLDPGSDYLEDVPAPVSGGTASYVDDDGAFEPGAQFYVVVPVESDGWRYPVSNRVGVMNFLVQPGN